MPLPRAGAAPGFRFIDQWEFAGGGLKGWS